MPGAVSLDETESHPVYSDREMKKQLEKERDHPSTSTIQEVHLQNQEVDKGDTSLKFSLVNENAKVVLKYSTIVLVLVLITNTNVLEKYLSTFKCT